MENDLLKFLETFKENQLHNLVSATMVGTRGSAPQDVGARILFSNEEILFGTIGGGKVEAQVLKTGRELLADEDVSHHLVKWNLQKDVGMTCGGEVEIFFEIHRPVDKWDITIFGAGHVSQELNLVLSRLNCQVRCIDHRSEWLEKLPKSSEQILHESPKDLVAQIPEHSFVVLMTMGHSTDLPILKEALKRDFPYLGVIGSMAKRKLMEHELDNKNFICPIGEDIGSNAPSEIAISIVSQLLKKKDEYFKTKKRVRS